MPISQKLPHVINLLLVIAIAYLVAQFITGQLTSDVTATTATSTTEQPTTPITRPGFRSVALFGQAKQVDTPKPVEKKQRVKAKLNLKLLGVVASSAPGYKPTAVISRNNETKAYAIGDTIMNGVKLVEVHARSIVVSHAGLEKIIELEKTNGKGIQFNPQKEPAKTTTASIGPSNFSNRLTRRLGNYKEKLQKNPMSLINLFVGEPVSRDGQMVGIRVRPGQDRELFKALQLKPKDIIMSINDIPITNTSRMGELMDLVKSTSFFNLEIERNNAPMHLSVTLPE